MENKFSEEYLEKIKSMHEQRIKEQCEKFKVWAEKFKEIQANKK